MNVRKAHRRWMAWQRYYARTQSKPSNWRLGGTHRGMVFAHADVMFAGGLRARQAYMLRTTWEYR